MKTYLWKIVLGLLCAAALAAVLFSSSSARAATPNCDQPTVQVGGVQQRGGGDSGATYDVVTPAAFTVTFKCLSGTAGLLISADQLISDPVVPGRVTNSDPVDIAGDNVTVQEKGPDTHNFRGVATQKDEPTQKFVFTDGNATKYSVTFRFVPRLVTGPELDAKADKGYVDTELGKKVDKSDLGSSYANGYSRINAGPWAVFRTGQFEAAGGVAADIAYYLGRIGRIVPEFKLRMGWDRLTLPNKALTAQGVPLAVKDVPQDSFDASLTVGVNLPAATAVDFVLGGGFALAVQHVSLSTIGQATNGHVWVYPAQTWVVPGAALDFDIVLHPTPGLDVIFGEAITLPFMLSANMNGGEKDVYAASFASMLTLGGQFEVTGSSSSTSSTQVGGR